MIGSPFLEYPRMRFSLEFISFLLHKSEDIIDWLVEQRCYTALVISVHSVTSLEPSAEGFLGSYYGTVEIVE